MPELTLPADPNVKPELYSRFWFRFFEILPGALVWSALLAPFILSLYYPLSVTIFILIFDVYWLIQTVNQSFILMNGFRRMKKMTETDWPARLSELEGLSDAERKKRDILDWRELYQVVILANYKEDRSILEASIQSVIDSGYPKERLVFVLANEERGGEVTRANGIHLQERYAAHFRHFIVSKHPDGIVGEVKAKGANVTWAAKLLVDWVQQAGISLDRVIVSTADADTRFSKAYFFALAYAYAVTKKRTRRSYQPVATYFNNIWEAPVVSRILAFGTTFWQLVESVRDYRLITFSTHAMSLQTLVDMDYWCTSIVNEDSRQFFRAFFRYKGDFKAIPLFVPIYMDAVHGTSFVANLKTLYLQQQRWAYGVEHFPYIVMESLRQRKIPLMDRLMLVWRAWQGTFSWATSSFFISLVGWIPIVLNPAFREQVAVSNFPFTTSAILSFTWIGVIVSTVITLRIIQTLSPGKKPGEILQMMIMWVLVPLLGIILSAFPCLDAITRLMFGKYIGFRVTEKIRPTGEAAI